MLLGAGAGGGDGDGGTPLFCAILSLVFLSCQLRVARI
jgi:hypothetical protein